MCIATPVRAGGISARTYQLRIDHCYVNGVSVQEEASGHLLPTFCPERHINDGGTFCIGYKAEYEVDDESSARVWWEKLRVFLLCQETAHASRKWPPYAQLSHGRAGAEQLVAEQLAGKFGVAGEYKQFVKDDTGPFASIFNVAGRTRFSHVNKRASCLCGKRNPAKRNSVMTRLECSRSGGVCDLARSEARRRALERDFWKPYIGKKTCCGTMNVCPLASP